MGFCLFFFFFRLTFDLNDFHLNKLKIIQYDFFFEQTRRKKSSGEQKTIERLYLRTIGVMVAFWKVDVLKAYI